MKAWLLLALLVQEMAAFHYSFSIRHHYHHQYHEGHANGHSTLMRKSKSESHFHFQNNNNNRMTRRSTSTSSLTKIQMTNSHNEYPNEDNIHDLTRELSCSIRQEKMDNVERIYAISDLHTDNPLNLDWLESICASNNNNNITNDNSNDDMNKAHPQLLPGPNDILIIAGDISHEPSKIKQTLQIITQNLQCHVFYVWGNHEAWIGGPEMDSMNITSSLEKISLVKDLCNELGVVTEHCLVGQNGRNPVWVLPIESWYDGSLALEGCEDLCNNFHNWPWTDFKRCVWPDNTNSQNTHSSPTPSHKYNHYEHQTPPVNIGKIPLGLTEQFIDRNQEAVKQVSNSYKNWIHDHSTFSSSSSTSTSVHTNSRSTLTKPPGLITFSHFLPNKQTLPDWKDPSSNIFQRQQWLDHGVPEVSAKFAKVSGSILIDRQIKSILPNNAKVINSDDTVSISDMVQHLHVFGHSHRPKDFFCDGIRYIHNPLGKPAEREMRMVSQDVGFKLIWDCQRCVQQLNTNDDEQATNAPDHHPINNNNDNIEKRNERDANRKSQRRTKTTISSTTTPSSSSSSLSSSLSSSSTLSQTQIEGGEIPSEQIIRFWEEKGGGRRALKRRMKHRKLRRRIQVKRLVRELERENQSHT